MFFQPRALNTFDARIVQTDQRVDSLDSLVDPYTFPPLTGSRDISSRNSERIDSMEILYNPSHTMKDKVLCTFVPAITELKYLS